jgi:hypothetical protein
MASETAIPYPPYDANAMCPKCGGSDVSSKWGGDNYYYWEGKYLKEHMRRECRNCRYGWLESPRSMEQPT